jgi:hypothetical protein
MKCSICNEEVSTCIIRTDPKADRRPRCFNCAGIQTLEPPFPVQSKIMKVSEISFVDWQDTHTCDGCQTYEKYDGNPFGEKCSTCVRAGQVADNYGTE